MGFKVDGEDKIGDAPFEGGMLKDVVNLNDQTTTWLPEFKQDIHCLIVIAGDCQATVDERLADIKKILASTIQEVKRIDGHVRPGKEDGHEQFVSSLSLCRFPTVDLCV